ncbi:MAG: hypothetical protein FE78DRAFT_29514 [Acidomyces sp. 'richmondensis']|nr:MAG: hypothetical protein FE78DRAFT_29514 [Acidomyces sp. 'richmondensis']
MASIEAKDPIYRDCALRKLADNQNAGDIYAMSVELVRKVHQIENGGGLRANLEQLMQTMAEGNKSPTLAFLAHPSQSRNISETEYGPHYEQNS